MAKNTPKEDEPVSEGHNTVRDRIERALLTAGLTLTQVSARSGISRSQLSRWRSGEVAPRPNSLSRLAAALGVRPEWLAHGEQPATTGLLRDGIDEGDDSLAAEVASLEAERDRLRRELGALRSTRRPTTPAGGAHRRSGGGAWPPLPRVRLRLARDAHRATPLYSGLAAGFGDELEEEPERYEVDELTHIPPGELAIARVSGPSMEPVLKPGDLVVARQLVPPVVIPEQEPGRPIPWAAIRHRVPEGEIVICQRNGDTPMVKRVEYRGSHGSWVLTLVAENREWAATNDWAEHESPAYFLKRTDSLTVHAQLVAIGELED